MQAYFRERLPDFAEDRNVVLMRVCDEQVTQHELVFADELQDGLGFPARVKQRRFARDFVPDQITVDRDSLRSRGDGPQFAPDTQILISRFPPSRKLLQFGAAYPDELS